MAYEVLEPEAELPGYEVIEPEQAEASRVKNDYLSRGGNPRNVLSPERQKVFDDTVRRRKAEGATDEEAVLAASDAVDQMGARQRPDGTIAAGFVPTEQAKAEGIIEKRALPAVEAAQARNIKTVASNTTPQGGGVAVGADPTGRTMTVEADAQGNELPGYEVIKDDQPSRLGAIARTVASEIIPTTAGGLAARGGMMVPGPLPVKIGAAVATGVGGYLAGQAAQERAGQFILGPERMQRINEVLQKDREAYPGSTLAASILTPTLGGVAGVGLKGVRTIRGVGQKAGTEAAEQAPRAAEQAAAKIELPTPAEGQGIRQTPQRIIEDERFAEEARRQLAKGDIIYEKFSYKQAAEDIATKTADEIDEIARSGTQQEQVVATAVQFNRAVDAGDTALQAKLGERLGKLATDPAQTLNAFKLIKTTTPEGYILGLGQMTTKANRVLTPQLAEQARTLFAAKTKAQGIFEDLANKARTSLDDVDIKAAITAEKQYAESLYRLQNFEGRLLPRRFLGETLPTVIQGNLLSPLSIAVNLWSNIVNAPLRLASRQGAFVTQEIGRALQKLVGKKPGARDVASPIGPGTALRGRESVKALGRGIAEGLTGLRRGISAEGLLAGEKIRGFQPLQAFKQFWTGQGLAKPIETGLRGITAQMADRARLAAEATLGVPAETMLRLLQLGDTPFRRLSQARLLTEAGQLAGKTARRISVETRLPTARQMAKIEDEAAQAVYQQDSALARAALHAANLFGAGNKYGAARLIGKTIIPYAKTPANVIDELLEFSLPPYALAKAGYAARAKNFRTAKMLVGKALTGSTLIGVAKTLSDAGVIGSKPSDSEKARDLQYQTLPPRTINITALGRFVEGDDASLQPGDRVIALEKLGIVGGILSTINAATEATAGENTDFEMMSLLPETLSFAFNQSFLKGTNSLLSAMLDGEGARLDKWISDYYGVLASIPFPNTLSAVSRTMRETMPDKLQVKDVEGEGPERYLNLFGEILKRRLPGADEGLARRVDLWGREVPQTPEGADPFMYNFLDVTKGREVAYDKITLGVYKIFKETEDGDVIPAKPSRNFNIGNASYRLDPDLYELYARARGKANRQAAEQIFNDPAFRRMGNADKVKVLKRAYAVAGEESRDEFAKRYGNRIRLGQRQ
jgi:hypothetical protein